MLSFIVESTSKKFEFKANNYNELCSALYSWQLTKENHLDGDYGRLFLEASFKILDKTFKLYLGDFGFRRSGSNQNLSSEEIVELFDNNACEVWDDEWFDTHWLDLGVPFPSDFPDISEQDPDSIKFLISFLFELEAKINIEGESINKLDQVTQLGKKLITNWENKK